MAGADLETVSRGNRKPSSRGVAQYGGACCSGNVIAGCAGMSRFIRVSRVPRRARLVKQHRSRQEQCCYKHNQEGPRPKRHLERGGVCAAHSEMGKREVASHSTLSSAPGRERR